jgi:hypothetical protein
MIVNSLIIVACFVVAILAFIGLFLALRESTPAVASEKKVATETVPEKKEESARGKNTVLLTDSEPATHFEKSAPAALERFPHDEHAQKPEEQRDADEVDYAELPTIRSIASYNADGREQSEIHEPQLQPLLEELRNLHQQMQSIEQRISALTERVEGLSGGEDENENWRAPSSPLKIPVQ